MTSTTDQLCLPDTVIEPRSPVEQAASDDLPISGPRELERIPRELGRWEGHRPGPTLICLGGLHGNEPAGVIATRRVLAALRGRESDLKGQIIGVVGNRQALAADQRFLDHDLNRAWHSDRMARLRSESEIATGEDREQIELDDELSRDHLRRYRKTLSTRPAHDLGSRFGVRHSSTTRCPIEKSLWTSRCR